MKKGHKSKRGFTLLASVVVVFGFALSAQAALIDRGGGLIYDDDFDITWLQDANYAMTSGYETSGYDANGRMTWDEAMTWATNLVYQGYSDWRLPTALNQDGSGPCESYSCTGSEMGHLYYTELGNPADGPLNNTGPFTNVEALLYWSGTEYAPYPLLLAYYFWFAFGYQSATWKDYRGGYYALPVRPGDSRPPSVPEPGALLLLGSGLAGLAAWRLGRKRG